MVDHVGDSHIKKGEAHLWRSNVSCYFRTVQKPDRHDRRRGVCYSSCKASNDSRSPFSARLVHRRLLLLDLLDDEQRGVEESIDTVLQTRGLSPTELGSDRTGDTAGNRSKLDELNVKGKYASQSRRLTCSNIGRSNRG